MKTVCMIQDPFHPYAIDLIKEIYSLSGIKSLVWHTTPLSKPQREMLQEESVTACIAEVIESKSPEKLLNSIKPYTIQSVIPWAESTVSYATKLMELLNFDHETVQSFLLFTSKELLRKHLISIKSPGIKPISIVETFDNFLAVAKSMENQFVVKPVRGLANKSIGFFEQKPSLDLLTSYWKEATQDGFSSFIVEPFISGKEYAINGQTNPNGEVLTYSIFRYERIEANGRPNVYHRSWVVRPEEQEFKILANYAERVIKDSGLKNSPFHMEAFLDGTKTPWLVEIGARPVGQKLLYATDDLLGPDFNCLRLAAYFYLQQTQKKVTWNLPQKNLAKADFINTLESANSWQYVVIDGIAYEKTRVYSLMGFDTVSQWNEFKRFVYHPLIMTKINPTVDLETSPYSVHLGQKGASKKRLESLANHAEKICSWNKTMTLKQMQKVLVNLAHNKLSNWKQKL